MATFDYIRKRLDKLEADRGTWESHWQEILDYVMPRKAEITFFVHVEKKEQKFYLIQQQSQLIIF